MKLRSVLKWLATTFGGMVVTPFLQAPATKLAEAMHFDTVLSDRWGPFMKWFSDLAQSSWYIALAAASVGFAVGMWADGSLRVRDRSRPILLPVPKAATESTPQKDIDDPNIGIELSYLMSDEWVIGLRFGAFFEDVAIWFVDEIERPDSVGMIEKRQQIALLKRIMVVTPNHQDFIPIIRGVTVNDKRCYAKVSNPRGSKEFYEPIDIVNLQKFMIVVSSKGKVIKSLAFVVLQRFIESDRPILIDEKKFMFKNEWRYLLETDLFE